MQQLTTEEKHQSEQRYWYSVVYNYMVSVEDWSFPEEATRGLLYGSINQEYINAEIDWPVMRWRELEELKAKY